MTGYTHEKNEPIMSGIISWQVLLAILASAFFWFATVVKPDSNAMVGNVVLSSAGKGSIDTELCVESLLSEIDHSEPLKLLNAGKTQEALSLAEKAIAANPYDVRTLMIAGDVIVKAGDKTQGIELLRKSTFMCPQSRYVRLNYARHLASNQQYSEAVDQYEALCKSKNLGWNAPQIEVADIYLKLNNPIKAAEHLKTAELSDTKNGAIRKKLGMAMAMAPTVSDEEWQSAFQKFLKGAVIEQTENTPQEFKPYVVKAGSIQKAEDFLRTEVATKPSELGPLELLANQYMSTNRLPDARELLSQQIAHNQVVAGSPDIHLLMAICLSQIGDNAGAMVEFKQAIKQLTG